MIEIDVIVLSFSKDEILKKVTVDCLSSLFSSEDNKMISFNCIVLESNRTLAPYQFENCTTIYPLGKFGFNKFVNIGLRITKSPYLVIANNDLFFHPGWATEILSAMAVDQSIVSASPVCSYFHPQLGIQINSGNYFGYEIRKEVAGWCIFCKRHIFNQIGFLDEKLKFWYCDSDYVNNLKLHGFKHMLISSSVVDHLDGRTTKELSKAQYFDFTNIAYLYYDYKWNHRNKLIYLRRLIYFKLRLYNLKLRQTISYFNKKK